MNDKEIAEIRRRFRTDKSNISHVRGCYVNEKKEIISEFDQSLGMMPEDDADEMLRVLKKTLSGAHGRNLLDIEFSTQQVLESEEHKLLSNLRSSCLKDDDAVAKLYEKIIGTLELDSSYLILLAYDSYDVFSTSADGEKETESSKVFNYFLCSVCPVRAGKATLSYYLPGRCFRTVAADTVLGAPELGFMFPAFDDRTANIYKTLMYTKDTKADYSSFVESVFRSEVIPLPAETQRQTFNTILEQTANESCNLHVVKTLHNQINEMIEEHKERKDEETLLIDKNKFVDLLESSGLEEKQIEAFSDKFNSEFGEKTQITPRNIVETRSFNLKTPDVVIKVNPKRTDLIKTRVIDGEKYILISAEEEVEVNGVTITIS